MIQKIIQFICVMLLANIGTIFTEEFTTADSRYKYTVKDETAMITHYAGAASRLNITSSIEHQGKNYTVTGIEDAFYKSGLISVTIPSSVTYIGGLND